MSEARRQRLRPPGREGAWIQGGLGGNNEEGEEDLGPEDVSSWHGVKVQ